MEFKCTYCHKPIYSVVRILDKTHFLHEDCVEAYEKGETKKELVEKWEKSNVLSGLKGLIKNNKLTELICCKDKQLIEKD